MHLPLPSTDQLGHAVGTSLNWAGAAAGTVLIGQAGAEAASAPQSAVYLAVIGLGGILTTLAKLFYDDRKAARESGLAGLREDYTEALAQIAELKAEIAGLKATLRDYAAALWVDRRWMVDVSARHGEPLPEGFGERPFDRPGTGELPTRGEG